MVEALNKIYITGTLVEHKVEEKISKDGKKYISGSIVLNSNDNLITCDVFCSYLTKSGAVNKMYEQWSNIPAFLNKRVNVQAEFDSRKFWSEKNNKVETTYSYTAKFIKAASRAEDSAEFSVTGYLVSYPAVITSDEKEVAYSFTIAQHDYSGEKAKLFRLNIDIDNSEVAEAIEDAGKGATLTLSGDLASVTKVVSVEREVGFGKPKTKVYNNTYNFAFVTSGSVLGDDFAYTEEEITKFNNAFILQDHEVMTEAQRKKEAPAANGKSLSATASAIGRRLL
jgi:hypothetical protein